MASFPLYLITFSLLSGYLIICLIFFFSFSPIYSSIIPGERDALLSRLTDLLASSSPQIGVHFEMASFVEESLMEDLLHYVIPHVCMPEQLHQHINLHVLLRIAGEQNCHRQC